METKKRKLKDVGLFSKRCEFNPIEKGFADEWRKQNDRVYNRGVNHGWGILQDLFINSGYSMYKGKVTQVINDRDRHIVATVIQWLGSNIGRWFIEESFKRAGYRITITKIEK